MKHGSAPAVPVCLTILLFLFSCTSSRKSPLLFSTYADQPQQLKSIRILVESIREFGGEYSDTPFLLAVSQDLIRKHPRSLDTLSDLRVEIVPFRAPEEVDWYFLSNWVFAAAALEEEAAERASILAMFGTDALLLREPNELILPRGIQFGYCPVMHKNISPLWSEPLDAYWTRAYAIMDIDDDALFPMVTPADGDTIRPYVNAGCLIVRPEKGILKMWGDAFLSLAEDADIREMCERDGRKRIFTFQVALTGALLHNLQREETIQMPGSINYPLFFGEMFGSTRTFHDIGDATLIRYEHFFNDPPEDWDKQLRGPPDRIAWIKERFGR